MPKKIPFWSILQFTLSETKNVGLKVQQNAFSDCVEPTGHPNCSKLGKGLHKTRFFLDFNFFLYSPVFRFCFLLYILKSFSLFSLVFLIREYLMSCAIWYHLYNLKSVKNTHGGVLLLVKLQGKSLQIY